MTDDYMEDAIILCLKSGPKTIKALREMTQSPLDDIRKSIRELMGRRVIALTTRGTVRLIK